MSDNEKNVAGATLVAAALETICFDSSSTTHDHFLSSNVKPMTKNFGAKGSSHCANAKKRQALSRHKKFSVPGNIGHHRSANDLSILPDTGPCPFHPTLYRCHLRLADNATIIDGPNVIKTQKFLFSNLVDDGSTMASLVGSGYRQPVVATSDLSGGCASAEVPFRVLVVDDDKLIHFILSKALSKAGMSVSCLTSGREALMVLEEAYDSDNHTHTGFPDAIILDLDLSSTINAGRSCEMNRKVLSGIDTAREIRRRFPRCAMTPIIAYTAETNVLEILPKLLDSGFSDYASKQSTTADLLARICVQTKAVANQRALQMLESRDAILRDILPSEVVSQLITGTGEVEPQSLGDVTILFADIVGFTTLSAKLDTTIMIGMLHSLFSAFDRLAEAHGAFKVETIGDCYMCVTGHEKKTKEAHARLMVHMGLAMVEAARDTLLPDGESVCIRVGIHTGSAHAGVVGLSRPRYCLFGDTVNVASRMESTSEPGRVHVSEATYASCVSQVMPQSFKHALNRSRMDLLNRDVSSGNASTPADISAGLAAMNCDNDSNLLEFTSPLSKEIKGKGLMVTRFCKLAMPTQ